MNPKRTHCKNCGVALDGHRIRRGASCLSCHRIAERARDKARYDATRARGDVNALLLADFSRRRVADATLDRGIVKRHCPTCGQWYLLERFDAVCPHCQRDHLVVSPVTFAEAPHAA